MSNEIHFPPWGVSIIFYARLERSSEYQSEHFHDNHDPQDQIRETKLDLHSEGVFGDKNAVMIIAGDRLKLGNIVNVNKAASELLGYTINDLMTLNVTSIMPLPFSAYHHGIVAWVCVWVCMNVPVPAPVPAYAHVPVSVPVAVYASIDFFPSVFFRICP
jgi:hypothetical protein